MKIIYSSPAFRGGYRGSKERYRGVDTGEGVGIKYGNK
jgi:hypothetical protein